MTTPQQSLFGVLDRFIGRTEHPLPDSEALITTAFRRSGRKDFVHDFFITPLDRMVKALNPDLCVLEAWPPK